MNRPARRAAALAALLLAFSAGRCGAEAVFGGTAGYSLGCLIDAAAPLSSTLDGALAFSPVLRVEDPLWRLELSSALRWQTGAREAALNLDRLLLSFAPADFLTMRIGRFAYLPGAGGIFSCTDWFSAFDLASLLSGDTAEPFRAGDTVQAGFTLGDFSLILTAMPFAPSWSLPDPQSPWFPGKDIPKSIHITFPTVLDTHLLKVIVEEPADGKIALEDVSVGVEVGASLPLVDVSLLAYHGRDNTALYRPRLDFPTGLWGDYRAYLTPVARGIDALGLDATLSWSSLTAWVDGSYTLSKTFLSRRLSSMSFAPELAYSPLLEYAAGIRWEPGTPSLTLETGYRGCWATDETIETVPMFLSSYLNARCLLRLWEDRISLLAQAICSTTDWSWVAFGAFSFAPSNEFSVDVVFPFFSGESDTELGQFSGNHYLSLRATARF